MKNKLFLVAMAVLSILVLISGAVCGQAPTATPVPTATPAPTYTPLPTYTPGPSPTPYPTYTPAPTSAAPTPTPKAATMKWGLVGPMTGVGALWGEYFSRAMLRLAEIVQSEGGIVIGDTRYYIDLVSFDTAGYTTGPGRAGGERLIYQDKCTVIVGVGSDPCLGVREVSEPNKVLLLAASWSPVMTKDTKYTFRTNMTATGQIQCFYDVFKKNYPNLKKVATLWWDDTAGREGGALASKVWPEFGYEEVAKEFYPGGTTDFTPILLKCLAAKPDWIHSMASRGGEAGIMTKQLYQLGYTGPKCVPQLSGWADAIAAAGSAQNAEGMMAAQDWVLRADPSPPRMQAEANLYFQRYATLPSAHFMQCLDYGLGFVAGFRKAQSLDADKVAAAIQSVEWDGVLWPAGQKNKFYLENGRNCAPYYPTIPSIVKDGKVQNLGMASPNFDLIKKLGGLQ